MSITRFEAILYAVLERASRSPEGYRFRSIRGITLALAALTECGLIASQEDGRMVITAKGSSVFHVLAFKIKQHRKPGLRPHRLARRAIH